MKLLIVGSSGFLGTQLLNHFRDKGAEVMGSSRRPLAGAMTIDLATCTHDQLVDDLRKHAITHLILCAAITDVDQCARDPHASRAVNVRGMGEALRAARELGIFPVFFSSDYVFDGSRDLYSEGDSCQPTTEYGRQKTEIENLIREAFPAHLIFRTSKLMSMNHSPRSILADVARRLRENKPFPCPEDQWITPVYVEDVSSALEVSLQTGITGTYHLATRELLTRYELAKRVAREIEQDPGLIRPCKLSELKTLVPRACHNSLSGREFEQRARFRFREISDGIGFLNQPTA